MKNPPMPVTARDLILPIILLLTAIIGMVGLAVPIVHERQTAAEPVAAPAPAETPAPPEYEFTFLAETPVSNLCVMQAWGFKGRNALLGERVFVTVCRTGNTAGVTTK